MDDRKVDLIINLIAIGTIFLFLFLDKSLSLGDRFGKAVIAIIIILYGICGIKRKRIRIQNFKLLEDTKAVVASIILISCGFILIFL